ncbi:alpha/beta hydrolase [Lactobacillus sp. CBA3605]|uniref:alpha/beta hydrolase n=1 Tax=Lactobacillus sp. CBA3605 TaxID=2099788 RepID=UPI000CFD478C|nr:alpha/beta hydrolase [Lactobacillus sp. CBA3605]AVK61138.1 alpha/beta hydrolase [Lactobacillus sp. CBA3605]
MSELLKVTKQVPQVDELPNLVYYQTITANTGVELRLSMLVPRTTDLKPAVLYFPGGGFTAANHNKFIQMRTALAQAGYVVAAAEYRVIPNQFPDLVEDGKQALNYLYTHADQYRIDTTRIAVLGDSAGGYLAQFMGVTNQTAHFLPSDVSKSNTGVKAVVSLYGFCDLLTIGAGLNEAFHDSTTATEALLVNGVSFMTDTAQSIQADQERAKQASPVNYVTSQLPPFLIMHGNADRIVSPAQADEMVTALTDHQVAVDQVILDQAGHGTWEWYQPAIIDYVITWLTQKLA